MQPMLMRLKWAAWCDRCGARIQAGTVAYYAKPLVWCGSHGATSPAGVESDPAPIPTPRPAYTPPVTNAGSRVPRASHAVCDGNTLRVTYTDTRDYLADAMRPNDAVNIDAMRYHLRADRFDILQGRTPWTDPMSEVERLRREIEIDAHAGPRRRMEWEEEGDEYSPERERAGYETNYRGPRKHRAEGARIARVYVNIAALGSVTQREFMFNGASLTAAIDSLEDTGVRCEVWAVLSSSEPFDTGPRDVALRVLIKRANDAVSLPHLLAWTAHVECRRAALFAWYCSQPYEAAGNMGASRSTIPASTIDSWAAIDGEGAFVWPTCRTLDNARMAIRALETHAKKN